MKLKTLLAASAAGAGFIACSAFAEDDPAVAFLNGLNEQLTVSGYSLRVTQMEMIGSGSGLFMGRTVIASDHGNKQLIFDWSPVDPNRNFRSNLTYAIDTADATADFPAGEQPDVVRFGFETWDEQQCSNIGIDEVPAPVADLGFVQWLVTGGVQGSLPPFDLDMVHGGFLPQPFWDIIEGSCTPGDGCGDNILGVNFTFTWIGDQDSDGNGREDTALKESYYNDEFTWVNDGVLGERGDGVFDFATVALHESGHALSRAHFGDVAIHHKKGLTTSPAAVMNAIYGGIKRELRGPDKGGHCSDWGAWPTQN